MGTCEPNPETDPSLRTGAQTAGGAQRRIMDEPSRLVELGVAAEANGWDGVFSWHHVVETPDLPVPVSRRLSPPAPTHPPTSSPASSGSGSVDLRGGFGAVPEAGA